MYGNLICYIVAMESYIATIATAFATVKKQKLSYPTAIPAFWKLPKPGRNRIKFFP
jgi:hypothetical protein